MTTTYLTGRGMTWPDMAGLWGVLDYSPGLSTALVIAATGSIAAMIGRVWWPGSATSKNIHKVHIRLGAVTAGGTPATFRVSLQDVSHSAGPQPQPDGGVDQSATAATNTLTANAINSFTMNADRTVARGAELAIVGDYSAFTAGDSVVISGLTTPAVDSSMSAAGGGCCSLFVASWAANATVPNVVLEFDDGSIGGLYVNTPFATINSRAYASNTTGSGGLAAGDERALEFTVAMPTVVDGCYVSLFPSTNAANFDIVLYDGTSALETVSVDANTVLSTSSERPFFANFSNVYTLVSGNTYRLAIKPTTTTNITLHTVTLRDAADRALWHGTTASGNSRVDAGSWGTTDTTELPLISLSIAGFDDGVSTGGARPAGGGGLVGY